MKATWKPQTKKPKVRSQKLCDPNASLSASRLVWAGPDGAGAAPRSSRRPRASGIMTTETAASTSMVACQSPRRSCMQRGEGHHRELPEGSAGRDDAERDRALGERRLARDHAEDRPEAGGRHADAGERVAEGQEHAFGRDRDHHHAGDVERGAARDRARRAEAVARGCRRRARRRPSGASTARCRRTTARARPEGRARSASGRCRSSAARRCRSPGSRPRRSLEPRSCAPCGRGLRSFAWRLLRA